MPLLAYFLSLGLEEDRATELHHKYYTEYGLALRGLVRHHEFYEVAQPSLMPCPTDLLIYILDPLDFDKKCDGSLPLEDMIKPDPDLRRLLQDIDQSKVRVWALTNAYKTVCIPVPSTVRSDLKRSMRTESSGSWASMI